MLEKLRAAIRERVWTQNLDERPGDRDGRASGSIFRHGRARVHLGRPYHDRSVSVSWVLGSPRFLLDLTFDASDREVTWSTCVPGLSLFFGVDKIPAALFSALGLGTTAKDHHGCTVYERELRLSIHERTAYWSVWADPHSWSSTTPRWRQGSWDPVRTLLGRDRCSEEHVRTERVEIPMPEGVYPATLKWTRRTWQRERLPKGLGARTILGFELTPDVPIGHPGKGESSWNCGDDATYSLSGHDATTSEQAIARMVETVLRSRRKYGGSHRWTPETPQSASPGAPS